jgi:hypothetical protein
VLVDEGQALEPWARHGHLEVVAAARAVDDGQLGGVRKRLLEERLQRFGRHGSDRSLSASSRFRLRRVTHVRSVRGYARIGEEARDTLARRVYL